LKKIFYHYCRQQTKIGHNPTFENVENNLEKMDISEFIRFCSDFQIPIKKKEVKKIFIEISQSIGKEINYSEFLVTISS
jgi:nucleoid-associated protein YejK